MKKLASLLFLGCTAAMGADIRPGIDSSWSRVDKYAEELKTKWNLEMEPDISTLCRRVDAILIESNDGRKHLPQAKLVIAAHKPMFIDKPLASTLEDARE